MWKLSIIMALIVLEIALIILGLTQLGNGGTILGVHLDRVSRADIMVGVGVVAFLWFAFAFRCPNCKANVGKIAMYEMDFSIWLHAFVTLSKCPKCGR